MKPFPLFMCAAALVAGFAFAAPAFAFSTDHSTYAYPDGASRFSDPDEETENFLQPAPGQNGQQGFQGFVSGVPIRGNSAFFGGAHDQPLSQDAFERAYERKR